MANLPEEEVSRTLAAMGKHKRPDGTYNVFAIAQELGLCHSTVQNRVKGVVSGRYGARPVSSPEPFPLPPRSAKEERQDIRSLDFWRSKARRLEAELAEAESAVREIAGLVARPLDLPPFMMPLPSGDRKKSLGLLHISDIHAGEVVEKDAVLGINAYSPEICEARLQRLFRATIEILPRWAADTDLSGIVVALNGDLVSGSIHEELAETDALTSQEQAWFVADQLAAGLKALADAFGHVFVPVTPGNHGRQTKKPRFKRVSAMSYDIAIGEMLRRHFRDDPRLTFHLAPARDAVFPILGWSCFMTHGDVSLRGGMGFAGAALPVLRGTKLIEWQASQLKTNFDILLTAHMHQSLNIGKVLANGSVIGINEFAHGLRGSPDTPRQWLALVTEKYPIRERCDLMLEDPVKPEKPIFRVPMRSG